MQAVLALQCGLRAALVPSLGDLRRAQQLTRFLLLKRAQIRNIPYIKWAYKTTNVIHLISQIRKVMRPWTVPKHPPGGIIVHHDFLDFIQNRFFSPGRGVYISRHYNIRSYRHQKVYQIIQLLGDKYTIKEVYDNKKKTHGYIMFGV